MGTRAGTESANGSTEQVTAGRPDAPHVELSPTTRLLDGEPEPFPYTKVRDWIALIPHAQLGDGAFRLYYLSRSVIWENSKGGPPPRPIVEISYEEYGAILGRCARTISRFAQELYAVGLWEELERTSRSVREPGYARPRVQTVITIRVHDYPSEPWNWDGPVKTWDVLTSVREARRKAREEARGVTTGTAEPAVPTARPSVSDQSDQHSPITAAAEATSTVSETEEAAARTGRTDLSTQSEQGEPAASATGTASAATNVDSATGDEPEPVLADVSEDGEPDNVMDESRDTAGDTDRDIGTDTEASGHDADAHAVTQHSTQATTEHSQVQPQEVRLEDLARAHSAQDDGTDSSADSERDGGGDNPVDAGAPGGRPRDAGDGQRGRRRDRRAAPRMERQELSDELAMFSSDAAALVTELYERALKLPSAQPLSAGDRVGLARRIDGRLTEGWSLSRVRSVLTHGTVQGIRIPGRLWATRLDEMPAYSPSVPQQRDCATPAAARRPGRPDRPSERRNNNTRRARVHDDTAIDLNAGKARYDVPDERGRRVIPRWVEESAIPRWCGRCASDGRTLSPRVPEALPSPCPDCHPDPEAFAHIETFAAAAAAP